MDHIYVLKVTRGLMQYKARI